jgi:hypothetical protein
MDSASALFARVEARAEIDVIGITDHDDVRGALEAREAHARGGYQFDLVTGIEVTTLHGHVLALWVDEPIASFKRLEDTVAAIHRAGGLAVVPHPFALTLDRPAHADRVMQIETRDAPGRHRAGPPMMHGWDVGERAARANRERWHLAETGGSDAHFRETVGTAYTMFPGRTEAELRRAILERSTSGVLVGMAGARLALGGSTLTTVSPPGTSAASTSTSAGGAAATRG